MRYDGEFTHLTICDMGISWEYTGFGQQQWDLRIHPVEKKTRWVGNPGLDGHWKMGNAE